MCVETCYMHVAESAFSCVCTRPNGMENATGILIKSITLGHETMLIHSIPFMLLELGLLFSQVRFSNIAYNKVSLS